MDGSSRPLFFTEDHELTLQRSDPNTERLAAWDALETFRRYATKFFAFQAAQQIEEVMPEDLVYQASFICANIRIPADSRQVLLEVPSLVARFQLAQKFMLEQLEAHEPAKDLN
jgi:ATP-dependent Lon protease